MRVFNTYVQFCSLSYWGPAGGPTGPQIGSQQRVNKNDGFNGDANQPSSMIQSIIQSSQAKQKERTRYQMTAYDILFNPLRSTHPFGK